MRSSLLPTLLSVLCIHCSINDAANISPPASGRPDPGKPAPGTPTGEVSSNSVGGTRLKARYLRTADGAEFAQGIFDTKLGTACAPGIAADGRVRCLPSERYLMNDPELHFADPSCQSAPLGGHYPFNGQRYGYTREPKDSGVHIYQATSKTPSKVAQAYRVNEGGVCTAAAKDVTWYPLAEIAPSEFVEGLVSKGADKGGVHARTFVGNDGSRIFMSYAATATDAECVVGLDVTGTRRCLPLKEATEPRGDAFSTSACGGTAGTFVDQYVDDAKFVVRGVGATCGARRIAVHEASPVRTAYQRDDKGVCVEAQGSRAVAIGKEVAPTTLPEVKESAPWGQGRVKGLYYTVGDEPVSLRAQFDTVRNEGCLFGTPDNGVSTCLPFALRINSGYFADAACTSEAIADYSSSKANGCDVPAPRYYLAPVDRGQSKQGHVYEIAKLADNPGSLFALNKNGVCEKTTLVAPGTYYQVGKEVPLSSFEKATVVDR